MQLRGRAPQSKPKNAIVIPHEILRLTLLAALAVASASATFAGPGPLYWQQRRASNVAQKPVAASAEKSPATNDNATGRQGTQANTAPLNGATAETAKCKAMCCTWSCFASSPDL